MKKITAVILAAGKSKRTKTSVPKVLLDLAGRPFIFHIIDTLLSVKYIDDIVVVLGHKKELIKKEIRRKFKNIKFTTQRNQNGTAKAVEASKRLLTGKDNVFVICADTPLITAATLNNFIRFFFKDNIDCAIITALFKEKSGLGRIVRDEAGNVEAIREKVDIKGSADEEVNSGIYCFKKKTLFDNLNSIRMNKKKKEFFLTDVINIFYRRGLKTKGFIADDNNEILGVNDQENLSLARRIVNIRFIKNLMNKGVMFIDPDTTFVSFDTKIGSDSVVYPFTFIEKNVIIGSNCAIGPFAHIRAKSVIGNHTKVGNFTEVNRSRLKNNVRMKHFSYLGDTTVGEDSNIGAGVVVANYDGKRKHKTVIHKGAFIGSDTVIVAPLVIGEGAATGAGSVVTRPVAPKTVVVGVPARVFRKKKRGKR